MAKTAESLVELLNKLIIRSPKIKIQNTSTRGRGLFATSPIRSNEKIFTALPLTFWPTSPPLSPSSSSTSSSSFCSICYKFNQVSCSDCQNQKLFQPLKTFTENLIGNPYSTQSNFTNLIAILAYRICLELQSGYQNTYLTIHLLTYPIINQTIHEEFVKNYQNSYQQLFDSLTTLGHQTQIKSFLTLEWYIKLIGILNLNSIRIPNNEPAVPGQALYDSVSLLNHSCQPNITIAFKGVEAVVIALRDLSPNEELFLDYVGNDQDLNSNMTKKFEYLNYNYGISCQGTTCACGKYR